MTTLLSLLPQSHVVRHNILSIVRKSLYSTMQMDRMTGSFLGKQDRFGGVTVELPTETLNLEKFKEQLSCMTDEISSLQNWIKDSRRTIWFKVSIENADVVPTLAANGFNFHHAKEGFVMMFRWLPTDLPHNIPPFAHTMVGVGGLVITDDNRVLVISEKNAVIPGSWKLPGGFVDPGESFVEAAIREVWEETSVRTEFKSLISIRHAKEGLSFNCADLYFVIALSPKTEELMACPREIAAVKWMTFDEYLNNPNIHETNRKFLMEYIEGIKTNTFITCELKVHEILKREYFLYYISRTMPKDKNLDLEHKL